VNQIVKLHELNVLHMDIKTDNILVRNSSNDENNNSIDILRKLISDNDYSNFINNRTTEEQNQININDMTKNQKKKHKKRLRFEYINY